MARGDPYKTGKHCANCGNLYVGSILDKDNICPKCKESFKIFKDFNNRRDK